LDLDYGDYCLGVADYYYYDDFLLLLHLVLTRIDFGMMRRRT
jgi:hypothetical protein